MANQFDRMRVKMQFNAEPPSPHDIGELLLLNKTYPVVESKLQISRMV